MPDRRKKTTKQSRLKAHYNYLKINKKKEKISIPKMSIAPKKITDEFLSKPLPKDKLDVMTEWNIEQMLKRRLKD